MSPLFAYSLWHIRWNNLDKTKTKYLYEYAHNNILYIAITFACNHLSSNFVGCGQASLLIFKEKNLIFVLNSWQTGFCWSALIQFLGFSNNNSSRIISQICLYIHRFSNIFYSVHQTTFSFCFIFLMWWFTEKFHSA